MIKAGVIKAQKAGKKSPKAKDNSREAYKRRKPYRDVFAELAEGQAIEITPDEGETLLQIRHNAILATKEIGREARIRKSNRGTLIVELKALESTESPAVQVEETSEPVTSSNEVEVTIFDAQGITPDRKTVLYSAPQKGTRAFYTVSDIAKELGAQKRDIRKALERAGVKSQRGRGFSRASRERNEIRLSYIEYQIIKEQLQREVVRLSSKG